MLDCVFPKSSEITEWKEEEGRIYLYAEKGMQRIEIWDADIIRVTYTQRDDFSVRVKPGINGEPLKCVYRVEERNGKIEIHTEKLMVEVDRRTGSLRYLDATGKVLLRERVQDSKELEAFPSYVPVQNGEVVTEKVQTPDGVKELIREVPKVEGETFYHTRLHLEFEEREGLLGLGQQEEGIWNLRGQEVYVHQANRKIAVPMLLSTKGYGLLINTYSPMIFRDNAYGSYIYTEADDEMDFFFLAGTNLNAVVKGYRRLTGKAAMLPKWAFGYMQSQERFETQEEILQVAAQYRKREIGLDCLVLDWCSWPDGQWGQKSFDPVRFPDPSEMVRKLHEENVHFMISIWPNMAGNTPNHQEMKAENGFLFASDLYNALDPHAREVYWQQVSRDLFCHDIDAWWCDSSEPLTVEWVHPVRMEPSAMYQEYCKELSMKLPVWEMNAYPLFHAQTLYEGQRREREDKRVCNLTRSAYTGQQKYGTILWSGDTGASWKTLRQQITAGLQFVSCGFPYWTMDIGAFFVKHGNNWFWDGEYNDTTQDPGYLELYTRWYQWGALLPIFRAHGTDCRREVWEFMGEQGMFYDAMMKVHELRYQLLPYLYSQAGMVWLEDASMMKPLVFDFSEDSQVCEISDQYLLGDSLMVCPVTKPMYFEKEHQVLTGVEKTREVYLPEGCGWYDYWTDKYYEGGQTICCEAPIDRIPLFVREGSVLPMAQKSDHVLVQEEIVPVVYAGKDCEYRLYRDAGDGYGYEKGEYQIHVYQWCEEKQQLTMDGMDIKNYRCIGKRG